ncbi:MAG: dihydrodipicolinate synthase family protein [Acidimicrobiales bacterium]
MGPEPLFRGVGVALVTFFDEGGRLLAKATAEHAAAVVDAGIAAVLVAGTTGEAAALDPDERLALVDAVRAAVPAGSEVPVIVGTGAPSARQAVALTKSACAHGADAVLALSPPGCADPRPYYDEVVRAAGPTPALAYHYPSVSPPGISVSQLGALPVAGCKDSSGDVTRLLLTAGMLGGSIWVGNPSLTLLAGMPGSRVAGAILALANPEPELCLAAFGGDMAAQRDLAGIHVGISTPADLKDLISWRWGTPQTTRLG